MRVLLAVTALLAVGTALAMGEPPHVHVSQRNLAFDPKTLTIAPGTNVDIVNDEGDLLHHAYVKSDQMNFDSGDQEPGQTVTIPFNVPGTFQVLCGIHPRMKLRVTVAAP